MPNLVTGDEDFLPEGLQGGSLRPATFAGKWTTGMKATTGRRIDGVGDFSADGYPLLSRHFEVRD